MPATSPDDSPSLYDHHKLRQWREAAGWSRTEAAARCGVSYPWYVRMESGGYYGRRPSLEALYRIAAAYGHETAELLVSSSRSGASR